MDLTATQSGNAVVYVENLYEGNLPDDVLKSVSDIRWLDWLQTWMQSLSKQLNFSQGCEVGLRLASDRQIQIFNSQYRSMDKPTDVLAFAATEVEFDLPTDLDEPLYLGDIVISLDTAWRQAKEQNHSLVTEIAWLTSHGLLHLLGWDHPDEDSLQQMLQKQAQLVQLLKI